MKIKQSHPKVGGLSPTRNVLLKMINLQTNVCLHTPALKYFKLYDKWTHCEGKRNALLRAKAIHHTVVNYVLSQPAPDYPFLKLTEGFPTAVIGLKKFCSSPQGIQATLSVTGHFRGVLAPGTPDLTPITEQGSEVPDELVRCLVNQIPPKWKFDIDQLSPIHHEFRTRMGPNGQALTSAAVDLVALKEEPNLMDHLTEYLDFFDSDVGEDLNELSELCIHPGNTTLTASRLAVKQEFGGKDRLFAMCDYWTQIALHPLHDRLASILKRIPEDATFGQDSAALAIKEWTKGLIPLYSLDLTSATDRFPVKALGAMIGALTSNHEYGNSWKNLIADRTFTFRSKKAKWAVGQPLGAYSSWPSFALCHHLVVALAAKRASIKRPMYRILGDDIVIASEQLKEHYISIMGQLGVKFSFAKTVSGLGRAEFAKRLFLQGNEITPLPIKLIQSSLTNYLLTKTLNETLLQRSTNIAESPPFIQISQAYKGYYSSVILKKVALLISFPFKNGNPNKQKDPATPWRRIIFPSVYSAVYPKKEFEGIQPFDETEVSQEELGLLHFFIRYKQIRDHYAITMKKADSILETTLKVIEIPGMTREDRLLHPVYQVRTTLASAKNRAHRALGSFWTEATKKGANAAAPNVNLPDIRVFLPKLRQRQVFEAKVILTTYAALVKYAHWRKDNRSQPGPDAVITYIQQGNVL